MSVSGHVDSGKTSLLDYIRGTKVAEREAGKITQHIGATEVPRHAIEEQCKDLIASTGIKVKLPGLLFIDTPGHEAFTTLRKRGGSIADLGVLMVDVHEGFKPQTLEALEILKSYKVPFIVALNKIDRFHGWNDTGEKRITKALEEQSEDVQRQLDEKLYEVLGTLNEKGFNSERFDRVTDITKQVLIIPTSALTGVGVPEVLMYLTGMAQRFLEKQLETQVTSPGKGTILEVKEEKGLGKTIDAIIYDGVVKQGDVIVVGGVNGPIQSKIKAILKPKEMDEIRDPRDKFKSVKEVTAACGVKIAGPGLEDALAGAPVYVTENVNETLEKVKQEIESVRIETDKDGVIIKTDTLGSLEAIATLFKNKGIPIKSADVGTVSKKDVMKAKSVKDNSRFLGALFAFNTQIDELAIEHAKSEKVKTFESKVIYALLEDYQDWVEKEKELEKREEMDPLVYPARIRILPNHVFRNAKPAIVGVKVEVGAIKPGYQLLNAKGEKVGKINTIKKGTERQLSSEDRGGREVMKKKEETDLKELKKNEEAAISIDGPIVGRHVFEDEVLYTLVPKNHIKTFKEKFKEFLTSEELNLLDEIKDIRLKE